MDDTTDPLAEAKADGPVASKGAKPKVQPFSNGAVTRGNLLRLHMDGTIEKIQGAPQPTGFTVVVPNRRSLEAAGPLAAKDGRIASIRVTNDPNGAELNVNFKDGVPNYVVRAKGDVLEIVLAGGAAAAEPDDKTPAHSTAKHTERGHGHGHGKRHGKNH
jgi:hypothetical protein